GQEYTYAKDFLPNKWTDGRYYDVDKATRIPAHPGTHGGQVMTKSAGEKMYGVKYNYQFVPAKVNQTHTAQGPEGTLPWQAMKEASPMWPPPPGRLTNAFYATAANTRSAMFIDRGMSPESVMPAAQAALHSKIQGASEAASDAATHGAEEALNILKTALINTGNERAGSPGETSAPFRSLTQAVWMVQTVYKQVYLPMALLLLLPGAVLSQTKLLTAHGALGNAGDDSNPLSGMLRSVIATFLIPATQLIVSYSIDVGNSLTYEVQGLINGSEIVRQAQAVQTASTQAKSYGEQSLHMLQNLLDMSLAYGLLVLLAFQIVMICYLLLLGPIAAAFLAWPGGVGSLFRNVFINWVNAVVTVSLWRFWWCVIVLVMVLRIKWLMELGLYQPDSEWEAFMFSCFLVLMTYVPFAPFECKPGDMVDKLLEKAQKLSSGKGKASSVSPAA
ncbi:MAG TPA: hypothetical protein V6D17_20990, partial [Candidatus Obscuribacterales bacterium]